MRLHFSNITTYELCKINLSDHGLCKRLANTLEHAYIRSVRALHLSCFVDLKIDASLYLFPSHLIRSVDIGPSK